jgi:hypothetical protein
MTAAIDSAAVLYSEGGNDDCFTPEYGVRPLLEFLEPFRGQIIWCPFDDASSAFVHVLQDAGHTVTRSHIRNGQDFYTYEPAAWDLMVSNPPFTGKRQIFERALSFGKPFALLMSLTWLNDAAPKQLFMDVDLELLMFDRRIEYLGQGGNSGKVTFSSAYFCTGILPKGNVMRRLPRA